MRTYETEMIISPAGTTYITDADLSENGSEWRMEFEVGGELLEVIKEAFEHDHQIRVRMNSDEGFRSGTGRISEVDTRHREEGARITILGLTALVLDT